MTSTDYTHKQYIRTIPARKRTAAAIAVFGGNVRGADAPLTANRKGTLSEARLPSIYKQSAIYILDTITSTLIN